MARMDLVSMRMILPNWLGDHEFGGVVDEVDCCDFADLGRGLHADDAFA